MRRLHVITDTARDHREDVFDVSSTPFRAENGLTVHCTRHARDRFFAGTLEPATMHELAGAWGG